MVLFITFFLLVNCIIEINPIFAVLYMILAFFNIYFILISLGLEFVSVLFLLIYVGAIAILMLFVVMMMNVNYSKPSFNFCKIIMLLVIPTVIIFVFLNSKVFEFNLFCDWFYLLNYSNDVKSIGFIIFNDFYIEFLFVAYLLFFGLVCTLVLVLDRGAVYRQSVFYQTNNNSKKLKYYKN